MVMFLVVSVLVLVVLVLVMLVMSVVLEVVVVMVACGDGVCCAPVGVLTESRCFYPTTTSTSAH